MYFRVFCRNKGKNKVLKAWKKLWKDTILPNLYWLAIINIPSALFSLNRISEILTSLSSENNVSFYIYFWAYAGLAICVLSFFGAIFYLVAYRGSKRIKKLRLEDEKSFIRIPRPIMDYEIEQMTVELYFADRHTIEQRQTINFMVASDTIKEIRHNLFWTGQTYVSSSLDNASKGNGYSVTDTTRDVSPYPVTVKLPHGMTNGARGKYTLITKVQDEKELMEPFLIRFIKCPTDKMTLKVTTPPGLISRANFVCYADTGREIPLSEPVAITAETVGIHHVFKWECENIEMLRNYCIKWEFCE